MSDKENKPLVVRAVAVVRFKRTAASPWENGIALLQTPGTYDPVEIVDLHGKPLGGEVWTYTLCSGYGAFQIPEELTEGHA